MRNQIVSKTIEVCRRINNGRTMESTFRHAQLEMRELAEEIEKTFVGLPPGPDGVLGEAVDVIICMIDLIYQRHPTLTPDIVYQVVCNKLQKWEDKYGRATDAEIKREWTEEKPAAEQQ